MAPPTIREIAVTNESTQVDPPDLDSTFSAIDDVAVHHCGDCDEPLGPDAPSRLFCSQEHQEAFYAARSEALVGYQEPFDIPQHVYNEELFNSPETTPAVAHLYEMAALNIALTGGFYFQVVRDEWSADGTRTIHEIRPMRTGAAEVEITNAWVPSGRGYVADWVIQDEASGPFTWTMGDVSPVEFTLTVDTSRLERSLRDLRAHTDRILFGDLSTWRPTGIIHNTRVATTVEPEPPQAVEFDFEHPSTAALAAEEPPLPVMAPSVLDMEEIQRMFDRRPGGFTVPQRLDRRRRIDARGNR